MYMRNISLSSAISFMNNENIHYTEGVPSTYGEAADIAVIGGNGNLKLSDLFN